MSKATNLESGHEPKKPSMVGNILKGLFMFMQSVRVLLAISLLVGGFMLRAIPTASDIPPQLKEAIAGAFSILLVLGGGFLVAGGLGIATGVLKHRLTRSGLLGVYGVLIMGLYVYSFLTFRSKCLPAIELVNTQLNRMWNQLEKEEKRQIQERLKCCGFQDVDDQPELPCPAGATRGCLEAMGQNYAKNPADSTRSMWIDATKTERIKLQDNFNCCGYEDPNDLPELPCPVGATRGCKPVLKEKYGDKMPPIPSGFMASFDGGMAISPAIPIKSIKGYMNDLKIGFISAIVWETLVLGLGVAMVLL